MMGLMIGFFAVAGALAIEAPATFPPEAPPATEEAEEVIVTARRSGIPVWRVTGPTATVILVGAIEEVSHGTRWDPGSLTTALRQADQIIFPQEEDFRASPFAIIGYVVKFLRMAKLPKGHSKQPINALFKSSPAAHIPCLTASISLVEAGPQAIAERSEAWAARRVPDVVKALPTKVFAQCSLDEYLTTKPDWRGAVKRALAEPKLTVAVLDLSGLAQPGGLLDELVAAGHQIKGPVWK